jgi:type III secretion protein R
VNNIVLVALAAIVPLVVLMLTSFVMVSVVLALLRNAIGAPDAPSGLVVMGVSLVLTVFVMMPVAIDMARAASATTPAPAGGELDKAVRDLVPAPYHPQLDAAERALEPLRGWLAKHASARDRATFVEIAQHAGRAVRGDELWVLAPAFLASELREAFAMAVLIFIPFLVVDLVVGLGLAALGLQTTSPQVVALPLKLLLFVSVDGWRLLLDSLLRGYA